MPLDPPPHPKHARSHQTRRPCGFLPCAALAAARVPVQACGAPPAAAGAPDAQRQARTGRGARYPGPESGKAVRVFLEGGWLEATWGASVQLRARHGAAQKRHAMCVITAATLQVRSARARARAFTHICMQHVRSFPPLRAQLFSYAVFFCMGVTALWQQDWLFDAQQLWAGWPRHEFRWAVGALIG